MFLKTILTSMACMMVSASLAALPRVKAVGDCKLLKSDSDELAVKLKGASGKGSLVLRYDSEQLDLSDFSHLAVEAENETAGRIELRVKATSDPNDPLRQIDGRCFIEAGQERELQVLVFRDALPAGSPWSKYFSRTKALPGYQKKWIFPKDSKVLQVDLTVIWDGLNGQDNTVEFSLPRGAGEYALDKTTPDDLPQPLVDEAGQLVSETWDGKVMDLAELPKDGKTDLGKYSSNGPLPEYSKFGGWLNGPRQKRRDVFIPKRSMENGGLLIRKGICSGRWVLPESDSVNQR